MEDKPKRRRSDSDLDPRFVSPPQTASQTAPANPFSAQTAGPSSNPFERASRTLRTSGEIVCLCLLFIDHLITPFHPLSAGGKVQTDPQLPPVCAGELQAES